MEINRMKVGEWGKIRAFFDVETSEGFQIKGFKLINGINGVFVGMPSIKDGEAEGSFLEKIIKGGKFKTKKQR